MLSPVAPHLARPPAASRRLLGPLVVALAATLQPPAAPAQPANGQPAHAPHPLAARVRLTLLDGAGQPWAAAPVRVAWALGDGWQQPDAGVRGTTDAAGQWPVPWPDALLQPRQRKRPTNFWSQTFSLPQDTLCAALAVELPWLGRPWLVVATADRFGDGSTAQLDGLRVYGRDEAGRFSVPAAWRDGAWALPGVAGVSTVLPAQVEQLVIVPARDGWTVELTLRRSPEPAMR